MKTSIFLLILVKISRINIKELKKSPEIISLLIFSVYIWGIRGSPGYITSAMVH